jgi:hypothetical protein
MGLESKSFLCVLIVIGIFDLAFFVPAFIYGSQGDPSCATSYEGITFTYSTWLYYFGLIGFIHLGVMLLTVILELLMENVGALIGFIVWVVYGLWAFAWYIIGAVLLFETLASQECRGEHIWKFGLALFIIHTVALCVRCKVSSKKE